MVITQNIKETILSELKTHQKIGVSTFTRSENLNTWINQDFYSLEDSITVQDTSISLSDIYHKIKFED